MPGEGGAEGVRVLEAEEGGDARDTLGVLRHAVGLAVGHHLQPVLEVAQEHVGIREVRRGAPVDLARRRQGGERAQRRRVAQPRVAPAPDQLQHLGGEFDLADPPAAELHVVPFHLHGGVRPLGPLVGVDLALDGMDVGHRREVEVAAPDEGADLAQEGLARRAVRTHRARLDHGGAFPVLAHALVVGDGRRDRHGERRRRRVGPQSQVGAEDIALRRAFLEQPDHVARDADIDRLGAVGMIGCRHRVKEHHEVDIGRIIQFPPAELAHAEHDQPGIPADETRIGPPRAGEADLPALRRVAQQVRAGRVDRGFREVRQRARDAIERPEPRDVGHRRRQRALALGLAQQRRQGGARRLRVDMRERVDGAGEGLLGSAFGHQQQGGRFPRAEFREVGAVPRQRIDQRRPGGRGDEVALRRAAVGDMLARQGGGGGVEGAREALGREADRHDGAGKR